MSKPAPSPVAAAFAEIPVVKPRVPCKVGAVLARLDDVAQAAVNGAIRDEDNWTSVEIARRLDSLGYPLKGDNVSRHRRGVLSKGGDACECPRLS